MMSLSALPDDILLEITKWVATDDYIPKIRDRGLSVHPILCTPKDEIPWILSIVLSPTEPDGEPHSIQNIRPDPRTGTARVPATSQF
jgi:hypothetical protein